jgi:hypothetical protein
MSLSRAFTTRRARKISDLSSSTSASSSAPNLPQRSLTAKQFHGPIRDKISAPIELLSTTNMLSYNAPDIYPSSSSSSSSSASGDDVFDRSTSMPTSPLTSPDTSSVESNSPKPNHLSSYFGSPSPSNSSMEAPVIPKRAPSHTKKLSESLARKRSISSGVSSSSGASSRNASISTSRSSVNMFSAHVDTMDHHNIPYSSNPFGLELAKVSELAEEYGGGRDQVAIVDPEEQDLISRGLFKFCAEDYMNEIHSYYLRAFSDGPMIPMQAQTMWI